MTFDLTAWIEKRWHLGRVPTRDEIVMKPLSLYAPEQKDEIANADAKDSVIRTRIMTVAQVMRIFGNPKIDMRSAS